MSNSYEMPWRPNFEATATAGWTAATGLSVLGPHLTSLPEDPYLWLAAICTVMGTRRGIQAYKHHRRRQRLVGYKVQKISISELKKKMDHHETVLQELRRVVIDRKAKQQFKDIWLGTGFVWDQPHAQLVFDIMKLDKTVLLPDNSEMGSPFIHGLNATESDIRLPIANTAGHVLITGTTRSGKTRLLDLLISQAVQRNETVIIIDPKGDKDLRENARRACVEAGDPDRFIFFHPAFPEKSVRLDPMRNFNRPTELATRLAALMPTESGADPFQAFGQMAINNIVQGLLTLKQRPNLVTIRSYLEAGVDGLVLKAVRAYCQERLPPGFETTLDKAVRDQKSEEKKADAARKFYYDNVKPVAPSPDLEGLLTMSKHDREHFTKMIASLLPIMNMLTSGPLGKLLSPDMRDADDERDITDMARVIRRGEVLYIGLDTLSDSMVGSAIGSIILSDLTAVAGDRYNYGLDNRPVNVFVDEAAEVLNDPFIQLMNKGGGAEFKVFIATQTFSDLVVRLGSKDRALKVIGNTNNKISTRVVDPETQKLVVENQPTVRVKYIMTTQGTSIGANAFAFGGNSGERLMEEEVDLFPAALLGQLPSLEYVANLSGGKFYKGRLPILESKAA